MKKKLLVRNFFTAILTVVAIISMTTGVVFASETDKNTFKKSRSSSYVSLNTVTTNRLVKKEKFLDSEGKIEQVVRINKDGSIVTEELSLRIKGRKVSCSHPAANLVAIANLPQDTKIEGTADCCFKYRPVTKYRCKQCGNSSIKVYGTWSSHKKHNYPLFGKKCKVCGYKK